MGTTNTVQTTKKSLELMEQLVRMEEATLEELSAEFDMPKSTAHSHLSALKEMEYVTNDDGSYKPTLRLLYWGHYVQNDMDLFQVCRPELKKLTQETGEHTSLVIEEDGKGVIVANFEGKGPAKFVTSPGTHRQLHANASGKVILANKPREEVEAILDEHGLRQMTPNTISDHEELFAELDQVREQGYAVNQEETLQGLKAIAAPITDIDDDVVGAIAVFGPVVRIDNPQLETDLPERVREAANVIEVNYNYE